MLETFSTKCFGCDLSPKHKGCKYYLKEGYARNKKLDVKRAIESWNYYHPDDLMPQKGFVVHHGNENKIDDSEGNLKKWNRKEHNQYHHKGNQYSKGCKRSEEFKEKLKGNQNAKNWTDKFSPAEYKEYCKKQSIAQKGGIGFKGPHTEETKEKISIAAKGRIVTAETKEKISKGMKGVKRSEEYCKKISKRMKGNQYSKGNKGKGRKKKVIINDRNIRRTPRSPSV